MAYDNAGALFLHGMRIANDEERLRQQEERLKKRDAADARQRSFNNSRLMRLDEADAAQLKRENERVEKQDALDARKREAHKEAGLMYLAEGPEVSQLRGNTNATPDTQIVGVDQGDGRTALGFKEPDSDVRPLTADGSGNQGPPLWIKSAMTPMYQQVMGEFSKMLAKTATPAEREAVIKDMHESMEYDGQTGEVEFNPRARRKPTAPAPTDVYRDKGVATGQRIHKGLTEYNGELKNERTEDIMGDLAKSDTGRYLSGIVDGIFGGDEENPAPVEQPAAPVEQPAAPVEQPTPQAEPAPAKQYVTSSGQAKPSAVSTVEDLQDYATKITSGEVKLSPEVAEKDSEEMLQSVEQSTSASKNKAWRKKRAMAFIQKYGDTGYDLQSVYNWIETGDPTMNAKTVHEIALATKRDNRQVVEHTQRLRNGDMSYAKTVMQIAKLQKDMAEGKPVSDADKAKLYEESVQAKEKLIDDTRELTGELRVFFGDSDDEDADRTHAEFSASMIGYAQTRGMYVPKDTSTMSEEEIINASNPIKNALMYASGPALAGRYKAMRSGRWDFTSDQAFAAALATTFREAKGRKPMERAIGEAMLGGVDGAWLAQYIATEGMKLDDLQLEQQLTEFVNQAQANKQ